MITEFIPYNEAIALKELGFDETCLTYYNYNKKIERSDDWAYGVTLKDKRDRNECLAPLYQQAFKFFRDKYNLLGCVYSCASGYLFEIHEAKGGTHLYDSDFNGPNLSGAWNTYEEAELECLKKLIEIIKK